MRPIKEINYSWYQNKESEAWQKLLDYIDKVAETKSIDFDPRKGIGQENFKEIIILPRSISKLKKVKRMWLYGSNLKFIPPEIGEMESLELFDPYTSYDLKWFPYEIKNCKKLRASRISTRALLGNSKNGKPFPSLEQNIFKYSKNEVKCSICNETISYERTKQFWITLYIATDSIPLLANVCSEECRNKLPIAYEKQLNYAHRGGKQLKLPKITRNTGIRQNNDDVDYMRKAMTEYFKKTN